METFTYWTYAIPIKQYPWLKSDQFCFNFVYGLMRRRLIKNSLKADTGFCLLGNMETSGRYGTLGPDSSTYFSVLFYYYFTFLRQLRRPLRWKRTGHLSSERIDEYPSVDKPGWAGIQWTLGFLFKDLNLCIQVGRWLQSKSKTQWPEANDWILSWISAIGQTPEHQFSSREQCLRQEWSSGSGEALRASE